MVYRFGDCRLDAARFELRRLDRVQPLEPQVFALLLYLIEHRDRVVTRTELNEAVWNGRIVTDSALNSCIKAARHAIGDDGKSQSRIRTVHRTGYRFVGEINERPESIEAVVADGPAQAKDVGPDPLSRTRANRPSSHGAGSPSSDDPGPPSSNGRGPPSSHGPGPPSSDDPGPPSSEGALRARGRAVPVAGTPAARRGRGLRLAAGALFAALLVLGGFGMWSLRGPSASQRGAEVVQLSIPDVGSPTRMPFGVRHVAISPDGARVAYAARTRLWVRPMQDPRAVAVESSIPMDPFFSPDGEWVAFFELTGLVKVPSTGGIPTPLVATADRPAGGVWASDGTILFATTSGLYRVTDEGGEPQLLAKPRPERNERLYAWPELLPDEQAVLYTVFPLSAADLPQIVRLDLRTGESRVVLSGGVGGRYARTGHLVYAAGETLYAVAVDRAARVTRGAPVPFAGVTIAVAPDNSAADFAFAENGTLVYIAPRPSDDTLAQMAWVDRRGVAERAALRLDAYQYPRISPDGTLVALDIAGANRDVWIWDLQRRSLTRLTTSPAEDMLPLWSADGRRVFFASARAGTFDIYSRAVTGSAEERVELDRPGFQAPLSVTPDGRGLIVYENFHDLSVLDLSVLDLAQSKLEPLLHNEFEHRIAELSPDGRWIAYESDESGHQFEIYLRPYPDVSTRREQVSIDGGRYPKWGPPGSGELYYVSLDGGMMAAAVELGVDLRLGAVTKLFDWEPPPSGVTGRPYDVSPLDGRFLMPALVQAEDDVTNISVVLNWFNALRMQVP